jgi:hypothetical protein
VYRYRLQGLADYGGRPVMFKPDDVAQFLKRRRKEKSSDVTNRKILNDRRDLEIVQAIARRNGEKKND